MVTPDDTRDPVPRLIDNRWRRLHTVLLVMYAVDGVGLLCWLTGWILTMVPGWKHDHSVYTAVIVLTAIFLALLLAGVILGMVIGHMVLTIDGLMDADETSFDTDEEAEDAD